MFARNFFAAAVALCLGLAVILVISSSGAQPPGDFPTGSLVQRKEVLRAPAFDDVSAMDDHAVAQIDAWLQAQVALAQYPSLSVAIVRDGRIAYQGTFGYEDLEVRRRATWRTSYHVASVTKVFTTLLAVMLHERGVIDLDQPVSKYLPDHVSISTRPAAGARITLRQLASHTSGLPASVPGPVQSVEGRYQLEPELLYGHLAAVELDFDPGTDERYSNLGMGLLGHALECAAHKPFDQLLNEFISDPLHLQSTAIGEADRLSLATGYSRAVPGHPTEHSYRERLAHSGGLVTSAEDLAKFLSVHMKPGLLSKEALAQLLTPTKMVDGSAAGTALGWEVRERASTGLILKKNGGRHNCSAWIGFAPDQGTGVVVVTNCGAPSVDGIGYWLLERSVPEVRTSLLDRKPETENMYARVAPFTGVRWENERPVVCVEGRWSPLISIDDIPIDRIMQFARKEFGEKAQKRFAEDLVQVLSKMGHEPEWTVTLSLATEDGQPENVQIRMTEDNRNLVRK